MRHLAVTVLSVLVGLLAVAQLLPATTSSFTGTTGTRNNEIAAAPDWTAPEITAVVVEPVDGTLAAGGRFRVYAAAADTGNPASGIASMTADLGELATTASASLSAGSWVVDGTTYGWRSEELTAATGLTAGSHTITVRAQDAAGNGPATKTGTATVSENEPFGGLDFTTTDRRGNTGLAQQNDEIAFVYNRAPSPASVLWGWDGSSEWVTVLLVDGAVYGGSSSDDLLGVTDRYGNLLPLGYVNLDGDYVNRNSTVKFTYSTMRLDGDAVEVTLGYASGSPRDDNNNRRPTWMPSEGVRDSSGTPAGTDPVQQSGSARRQF